MNLHTPLSAVEHDVLNALAAPDVRPLTQRDLHDRTGQNFGALATACRHLVKHGLSVRFSPRPSIYVYVITDDGRAQREQLRMAA